MPVVLDNGVGIPGLNIYKFGFCFILFAIFGPEFGLVTYFVSYFGLPYLKKYIKKREYKYCLDETKKNIIKKFDELEYSFSETYKTFKDTLINELKLRVEVYHKVINNDDTEWENMKKQYDTIKKNTLKIVKENNYN